MKTTGYIILEEDDVEIADSITELLQDVSDEDAENYARVYRIRFVGVIHPPKTIPAKLVRAKRRNRQ